MRKKDSSYCRWGSETLGNMYKVTVIPGSSGCKAWTLITTLNCLLHTVFQETRLLPTYKFSHQPQVVPHLPEKPVIPRWTHLLLSLLRLFQIHSSQISDSLSTTRHSQLMTLDTAQRKGQPTWTPSTSQHPTPTPRSGHPLLNPFLDRGTVFLLAMANPPCCLNPISHPLLLGSPLSRLPRLSPVLNVSAGFSMAALDLLKCLIKDRTPSPILPSSVSSSLWPNTSKTWCTLSRVCFLMLRSCWRMGDHAGSGWPV